MEGGGIKTVPFPGFTTETYGWIAVETSIDAASPPYSSPQGTSPPLGIETCSSSSANRTTICTHLNSSDGPNEKIVLGMSIGARVPEEKTSQKGLKPEHQATNFLFWSESVYHCPTMSLLTLFFFFFAMTHSWLSMSSTSQLAVQNGF